MVEPILGIQGVGCELSCGDKDTPVTSAVLWFVLGACCTTAAIILFMLVMVLAIEAVAYLRGHSGRFIISPDITASYVIVVPAHDEVGTIEATLATLVEQVPDPRRILVVADNCSDSTADVARAAGARVIERHDPSRRGKGYALDFAVRRLAEEPPEVVIILDADCIPEPGAIDALVAHCHSYAAPVQARYELNPPAATAGTLARVGAFAWRVKNVIRPTGLANLGAPCLLMGTGMAFPWRLLSQARLATAHLVEDMALGLDLAASGHGPRFLPEVGVHSTLPPSREGQVSQRTRWETGHLQVIATQAPKLYSRAIKTMDWTLLLLALHVSVPPLAFLVLLLATSTTINCAIYLGGIAAAPLIVSAATWLLSIFVFAVYWMHAGRSLLSRQDLLLLPGYILAKLGIYGRAMNRRGLGWIRSKRD